MAKETNTNLSEEGPGGVESEERIRGVGDDADEVEDAEEMDEEDADEDDDSPI